MSDPDDQRSTISRINDPRVIVPLTPGIYMHIHVLRSVVEAKDDPGTSYTCMHILIDM